MITLMSTGQLCHLCPYRVLTVSYPYVNYKRVLCESYLTPIRVLSELFGPLQGGVGVSGRRDLRRAAAASVGAMAALQRHLRRAQRHHGPRHRHGPGRRHAPQTM
jgi:hypothetical protein